MSPAPSPVFHNPPDAPETALWSSAFAQQVNADLRGIGPGGDTAPAPYAGIVEKVNRVADQPRRAINRRRLPTKRCLIAIFLAVVMVAGVLIGAMVAIAKNNKHGVEPDTLLVNGESTSTASQSGSRTTSESKPWLTTTAISGSLSTERSATFTQEGPTVYSKSLQIDSSFGSSVEIIRPSLAYSITATTENTLTSSAALSTTDSYDLSTAPASTPTHEVLTGTLASSTTTQSESLSTDPATSSESMKITSQLTSSSTSTEALTTPALSDSTTAHSSNTTEGNPTASMSSGTSGTEGTPAAGRPSQGVPHSPTPQVHVPGAHVRPEDEELRALQRLGHHRYQDQDGPE